MYGATAAELLGLAHEMPTVVRTLLMVGHDPAMRELTLDLASSTQPDDAGAEALERVRTKFPTAAIAVLAFTGSWRGLEPEQGIRLRSQVGLNRASCCGGHLLTFSSS